MYWKVQLFILGWTESLSTNIHVAWKKMCYGNFTKFPLYSSQLWSILKWQDPWANRSSERWGTSKQLGLSPSPCVWLHHQGLFCLQGGWVGTQLALRGQCLVWKECCVGYGKQYLTCVLSCLVSQCLNSCSMLFAIWNKKKSFKEGNCSLSYPRRGYISHIERVRTPVRRWNISVEILDRSVLPDR